MFCNGEKKDNLLCEYIFLFYDNIYINFNIYYCKLFVLDLCIIRFEE